MIKQAKTEELEPVVSLALQLWPDHQKEELIQELGALLTSQKAALFLVWEKEEPVGFAQCQLRHDYVEGTSSSPVGYLEGIFVLKQHRGKGWARQLVTACEGWAKEKGCTEFASDCEAANSASLGFHLAAGFQEANRIICFIKKLEP